MAFLLGIDTGGPFTDAVIFHETRGVLASAKAPTRRRDLGRSISEAIDKLPDEHLCDIGMVALSTTLATNAIVEGKGSRICLVLIGYPDDALDRGGLGEAMGGDPVVFVSGGHTVEGNQQEELDEKEIALVAERFGAVSSAFAVSGYFGVKNPDHEIRARRIIRAVTGKPVTCGHELSRSLHASRRALTAAINARLVHLLENLIASVKATLEIRGIDAPLMVVKGDGSLVAADFALEYPIETILSGPAASVLGAAYLSGVKDAVISDIGGTTTDVAIIRDGLPLLNVEGAVVGGFRTMVEAVKIRTEGLGGDSEVQFKDGELTVGPMRVIPLSLLAAEHPEVLAVLGSQLDREHQEHGDGIFVVSLAGDDAGEAANSMQRTILEACRSKPCALSDLYAKADVRYLVDREVKRLEQQGLVLRSGFTPSDASHVLGTIALWSREGAELGAGILSRSMGKTGNSGREHVSNAVVERLRALSASEILASCIEESSSVQVEKSGKLYRTLAEAAFENREGSAKRLFDVDFKLGIDLVAIGAPAALYYPGIGELLHADTVVPRWAEVANAVGAAAGSVVQRAKVVVRPVNGDEEAFRVHYAEGVRDFREFEEAVLFGREQAAKDAESKARKAGAAGFEVRVERRDIKARATEGEVFIETEILATAVGRPRFGRLRE